MYYDVRKIKGHYRENYFKTVGYPSKFKYKKKDIGGHGYGTSHGYDSTHECNVASEDNLKHTGGYGFQSVAQNFNAILTNANSQYISSYNQALDDASTSGTAKYGHAEVCHERGPFTKEIRS